MGPWHFYFVPVQSLLTRTASIADIFQTGWHLMYNDAMAIEVDFERRVTP